MKKDFIPNTIIKYQEHYLKIKVDDKCNNCFFNDNYSGCSLPKAQECFYYGGGKTPIIFEEISPIEGMILMKDGDDNGI